MKYTPHSYQRDMANFIVANKRCNLYAGMGTGKTGSTYLALSELLKSSPESFPVLVIAPKRVKNIVWPGEVEKFHESFGHIKVQVIDGSEVKRIAALANKSAHVFTINYELVPWLIKRFGEQWPFRTVIADEASKLRNLRIDVRTKKDGTSSYRISGGSKRAGELAKIAHRYVDRWVNLTGTPCPNGIDGLWGSNWFVDKGKRLSRTYSAFEQRWFQKVLPHPKSKFPVTQPLPHAQREIENAIRDVTMTIKAEDYFDLPPLIENTLFVDLPPEAVSQYKLMAKKLFAEINGHEIEAVSAAAKSGKLLQFSNGAAYIDAQGAWTEVHRAKIEALEEIVEEACGMPILVAYHFKSDLTRLLDAFPNAKALGNDPRIVDDFNAGKIPMLLAHPASAGHGLSLQHGTNILVYFSVDWNLENFQQIAERIGPTRQAQSGYKRPVYIHYIVARDTIDGDVLWALRNKASIQETLLTALKRFS